jgi:hypothetical protein
MTHFRSLRLTHTKNTICRGATGGSSNLIHAEGVRGDFSSSAPKARKGLRLQEETAGAGDRIDHQGSRASPHSICRAAGMRSCEAAKHHPTGRGGGSLLASKVGLFLASAEELAVILLGAGVFPLVLAEAGQARITGAVSDASGALIPSAPITVRNLKTGQERTVAASEQGRYVVVNLRPARYSATGKAGGLGPAEYTNIELGAGQERTLNLILQPAAM